MSWSLPLHGKCLRLRAAVSVLLPLQALSPGSVRGQSAPPASLGAAEAVALDQFTNISSVRELATGNLLVADRAERRVVLVEWKSPGAQTIGRRGAGPGEYEGVGWVFPIGTDSTLFMEAPMPRYHMLVGAEFARTYGAVDFGLSTGHIATGAAGSHILAIAPQYTRRGRSTISSADSLVAVLFDIRTGRPDTVAVLKGTGGVGRYVGKPSGNRLGFILTRNPLVTQDESVVFSDGWIAVLSADPYQIAWRTPNGEWSRHSLPYERIAVNEREKCAALRRMMRLRDECMARELEGWPEFLPAFELSAFRMPVLAASYGQVAVLRLRRSGAAETVYDIVNRQGKLTCQLRLAANEHIVGFGSASIYSVATDDMDLQALRRHAWPAGCAPA